MRLLRTYSVVLLCAFALLTSAHAVTKQAQKRRPVKKTAARRRVSRVVWNPLFSTSHAMLVRQNQQLDALELPRIANEKQLLELEAEGLLVPVATTDSLVVASNLLVNRRYCRPWTREFLEDLGSAYYEQFGQPILATSLVRTADQQRKLRRRIRGAAPHDGETASTHLTGVTVDILKRGMTKEQHSWLEAYLLPLKEDGHIEPIEERRQPVFHIVVFNTYADYREQKLAAAEAEAEAETDSQSAVGEATAVTEAQPPAEAAPTQSQAPETSAAAAEPPASPAGPAHAVTASSNGAAP